MGYYSFLIIHCKQSFSIFPSPSQDVTYQTLPRREYFILYNSPVQGEFGKWHPGRGQEYRKKLFYSVQYVLLLTSGMTFNNIRKYLDIVNPYWYRWELPDPHGTLGRHAVAGRLLDERLGLTSRLWPKKIHCFPDSTFIVNTISCTIYRVLFYNERWTLHVSFL